MLNYCRITICFIIIIIFGFSNIGFSSINIFDDNQLGYYLENDYEIKEINVNFSSGDFNLYGKIFYPLDNGVYPGIVFCEGIHGYISCYEWLPREIAKQGYISIIFDLPSQGYSEGIFPKKILEIDRLNILISLTSIIESPYHYIDRNWVKANQDALSYLKHDSPVSDMINHSNIGLIGHSLGGLTVTEVAAVDDRFDCIVAISHANPIYTDDINIPIMFIGGDVDIGYFANPLLLSSYIQANSPKEIIMIQGGNHAGFTSVLFDNCPCPSWQKDMTILYSSLWFDYFLKDKENCRNELIKNRDHLSNIINSCYDFGSGDTIIS